MELLRWCMRSGVFAVQVTVLGVVLGRAGRAQRGLSRPCMLLSRRMQPSRTMWETTSTHQQAHHALAAAVTVVSLIPLHLLSVA